MVYINGILASEIDLFRFNNDVIKNKIKFIAHKNKQGVQFIWTE